MAPAAARPKSCTQCLRQRNSPRPAAARPRRTKVSLKRSTGDGGCTATHPAGLASQPAVEPTPVVSATS
eukprot:6274668-Alexandrium_andersonii.AAC.1